GLAVGTGSSDGGAVELLIRGGRRAEEAILDRRVVGTSKKLYGRSAYVERVATRLLKDVLLLDVGQEEEVTRPVFRERAFGPGRQNALCVLEVVAGERHLADLVGAG